MCLAPSAKADTPVASVTASGLVLDGKPVAWADVQVAAVNPHGRTLPCPDAVRLISGEVLRGRLVSASADKVTFELGTTASRTDISRDQVWAVDFVPDGPAEAVAVATLYRRKVEPLPGTVLWIDAAQIAIDSPLGVLTLPREGTLRYVFRKPASEPLAAGEDEVHLLDGSILRGELKPAEGAFVLKHKLLGELSLPAASVRALRRRPAASLAYLADLSPKATTKPLISAPAEADLSAGPAAAGEAATQVRIAAETTARYELPSEAAGGGTFLATVAAADDARGEAVFRLIADGKVLLEKNVAPGAAPEAVRVAVPATKELTIQVAFGERLLLPAAVVLGDPRVAGGTTR